MTGVLVRMDTEIWTQRERYREKRVIYKLWSEASKETNFAQNLISDCPHYDEKTHGCCLGVQSVVLCTGSPSKLTAFKLGVTANPWFIVSIYLLVIRLF